MRPEPAVLWALSNTQMSGPHGNLLPGLLTAIQGYMWWGRVPFSINSYKVDILGKEAVTRNTEEKTEPRLRRRGGIVFVQLCCRRVSAWPSHQLVRAFQLQMYPALTTTCLTAADNPADLTIFKIWRVLCILMKSLLYTYLWWSQSLRLSWCRCDTEIKEHSQARLQIRHYAEIHLSSLAFTSPGKRHIKYL